MSLLNPSLKKIVFGKIWGTFGTFEINRLELAQPILEKLYFKRFEQIPKKLGSLATG